jgi:hypothetical protein
MSADLLDQLGVVPALDEDPGCAGDAGLRAVHGDRPRRRPRRELRSLLGDRRAEDHRAALQQEARPHRKRTPLRAAVLQRHRPEVPVDSDDLAAPVGHDLLDHQAEVGRDLRRAAVLRGAPVVVEDVGAVAIKAHRTSLPSRDGRVRDRHTPVALVTVEDRSPPGTLGTHQFGVPDA